MKTDSWKYRYMSEYELNQVITDLGFDAHQKRMAKRELNARNHPKYSATELVIKIGDLKRAVTEAHKGGYNVSVVINGEYYDIEW